jgi:hypothetical protein
MSLFSAFGRLGRFNFGRCFFPLYIAGAAFSFFDFVQLSAHINLYFNYSILLFS